eukprot:NODE_1890_length_1264_cov_47.962963_g1563_i0.p4 GENE.NODE_1890_length_1264_cov_47.962963_g1563_i0~~NODE_1890_length_1264_cov_47.962963_g1563_i0.p4  ORF type:complete len:61 (+),score=2.78 NODE_1890_length_1264_cov_47.962963_g1563_i0:610-792(+)
MACGVPCLDRGLQALFRQGTSQALTGQSMTSPGRPPAGLLDLSSSPPPGGPWGSPSPVRA